MDVTSTSESSAHVDARPLPADPDAAGRAYARELSASLTELLRRFVDISPRPATRQFRAEFLSLVREPGCCWTLQPIARPGEPSATTLPPPALLDVAPSLCRRFVDLLLGDNGTGVYVGASTLTPLEQRLAGRVVAIAAKYVSRILPEGADLDFAVADTARPTPCGHVETQGLSWTFKLSVGDMEDTIRLFLSESPIAAGNDPDEAMRPDEQAPTRRPLAVPVELTVCLPDVTLDRRELDGLDVGDVLTMSSPADGEVLLRIAGIPKYRGRLGTCGGRPAVTILGGLDDPTVDEPPTAEA